MPVCTTDGNTATLEIDIKYYRRFLSLSWVKGTVTLNDIIYYDSKSAYGPRQEGGSYWDWYWYLGNPDNTIPANTFFYHTDEKGNVEFFDSLFILFAGDNNSFNKIEFLYSGDDIPEGTHFYGPAQSAEEAAKIKNGIYGKTDN